MIRSFLSTKASGAGLPILDPLSLPNLEFYVNSSRGTFSDLGITPALDGQLVEQWNDLSPFGQHTNQVGAANRPTLRKSVQVTPNGNPAVQFGNPNATTQLGFPGVARAISNANGYTCYMWYNSLFIDTVGFSGQCVFDMTLGQGFRFDQQFATGAPPNITALEYNPGSFGLTVPVLGWQLWSFIATPPVGVGPIKIFRDIGGGPVQVGPTSGTYGPLTTTVWNMALQDRFLVSANPALNIPFVGTMGAVVLFSKAHDTDTWTKVQNFLRTRV